MNISVVIPLYNEEESLPELHAWIARVMEAHHYTYEIIFVNDGSTDHSWEVIEKLCAQSSCVKGIKFRRNYGKSPALFCGFRKAEGDVVITMDADLQDSPDEIPELYRMITEEGYDLVSGYKKKRYDPLSKTIPTKLFNATARAVSGIHNLHDFNCGLKAYRKDVVKNIEVYGEMHRYIPYLAKNAGFTRIGEKVVHHQARKYGSTKFGGLNRFFNGETTERVLSNVGTKPLGEGMLLASKGRLYMDTDRLSDEDLQSLFVNNPDYYFRYQKAKSWRKLSWLPVSLGFSAGLICASVGGLGDNTEAAVTAGVLMMLGGGAGTYLMCWKGNKEVRALANGYNQSKQRGQRDGGALSLVGTSGGVGLRLTF